MTAETNETLHPRERMIQSAIVLVAEQGVKATTFPQIVQHSGAPRGSIYHHFPGGKAQLLEEATRYAGEMLVKVLNDAAEKHDDPVRALEAVGNFWRTILYTSDFAAGCPVVAAVLESDESPGAREAAREAFVRWQELEARMLIRAGVDEARARALAATAISAVEGAVILSRSQRSNEPLDAVLGELETLFAQALPTR
jgi:TetR/AcrR family transcriptional regulator, lmrAB and yxaGH operons repressor